MTEITLREHLRRIGCSKSAKKAAASRRNAEKGGRPKTRIIRDGALYYYVPKARRQAMDSFMRSCKATESAIDEMNKTGYVSEYYREAVK
ncbi:MAG: hypothetical protein WC373_01750 [Smithella sp.]|jgi:hypothetical protein